MEKTILSIPSHLVVIGGSAGSLHVMLSMVAQLKSNANVSIVFIMHRKAAADDLLTPLLQSRTKWPVIEISDKDPLLVQTIYVAPADYHVLIEKDFTFSLDVSEKIHFCRPAIDITFESAADLFRHSATGILLSGANADGVEGLIYLKARGGICMVQDPQTAEVPYMPKQAIEKVAIDGIIRPDEIATYINSLI